MFDAIAGRYDLLNPRAERGLDWQWRRRAVRELGLTGNDRVIDLCTGTADLAMAALRARPTGAQQVVGSIFRPRCSVLVSARCVRRPRAARAARARDAVRLPLGRPRLTR